MAHSAFTFFESKNELPNKAESELLAIEEGIGVITIHGPLIRKPDIFSRILFGAIDHEEVANAIREAISREDVLAIFLDIDSPGGTVSGTPELAGVVADASKAKYVYAFTGGQMCSAAYWIASQCDAIYATPSARVGSIGVILPVIDSSEAFRSEGLKVEVFAAGKFKSTGTPGVPLTDEQRQWLQSDVEEIFSDFQAAVLSRSRKIPEEAMQGQTFSARKAQRFNLSGVVKDRGTALYRLRLLHVPAVDTSARGNMKSIEEQLHDSQTRIAGLERDAQARESLLNEAGQRATDFKTKFEEQTHAITALTVERDALAADLTTVRQSLESVGKRNAELESAEKDLEQRATLRAAQIAAEMGSPIPAKVTAQGDAQTEPLIEQFKAITDPKEQTLFWRKLTPQQKALILNAE